MPDAKPNVKAGKKLPKWALPVGAVGVVAAVLYLRKKKSGEAAAEPSNTEQLNRQSFIPVTGENVAGVGASGGSGSSGSGEGSSNLMEFLKLQSEENKESRAQEQGFFREVISTLTGGGAPTSQAPAGVVQAPAQGGATPSPPAPNPPAPNPPAPSPPKGNRCPPSHPYVGPHGCFANVTCGNGCAGHRYTNGTTECQHRGSGNRCTW